MQIAESTLRDLPHADASLRRHESDENVINDVESLLNK
jgi:hypothetical protein